MAKEQKKKEIRSFSVPSPPRKSKEIRQLAEPADAWAIVIFALVTLVFFWGHISNDVFLWEDFTEFTYPNEVFAARSFMSGVIPFWNPFTFCGMPFVADLQIGFFYPGNQLMYLLSGGTLSAWLAQFFVVLHYFVAMVGAWKLARGYGIGWWGSLFSGITYALSGILVAHMIHPNMLQHLAWFPLVVYFFHRGVADRSWFHAILAGIVLGISMLSGHPQSTLYVVFFLFCYAVFLLVRALRSNENGGAGRAAISAAAAAIPVVVGIGIFAIQLLPSQELAGLSERAVMTEEKTLEGAMTIGQLTTLVVPKIFGVAGAQSQARSTVAAEIPFWLHPDKPYYFWETAIYIGVVALLLMIVGLASKRLGALRWFLGGMALLGILYAVGNSFFVHTLLNKLPLFDTFRSPARMAIYLSLGGAILAGAGLERVVRWDDDEKERGWLLRAALIAGGLIVLVGILALTGVLASMLGAPAQIAAGVSKTGLSAFLVGLLATATIWASAKGKIPAVGAAVSLLLLATIDLFIFGSGQNSSDTNPEEIYKFYDTQYAMFKAAPPKKLTRLKMRGAGMLMQRNQGPYSGIMLFEGYNPLLLARRVPPARPVDRAFDLIDIGLAVSDDPSQQGGIVERPTAYPHARMLYDVRIGDTAKIKQMLADESIDLGKTVLLEKDPGIATDGTGSGTAEFTRYDPSELELAVTTDKPGILLLSEVWYPAWKVEVDGQEKELLIGDYSLRAVAVPAGKHTVTMRYQSSAFSTGMWITIVTSLLAVAGAVAMGMRRRTAGQRDSETTGA